MRRNRLTNRFGAALAACALTSAAAPANAQQHGLALDRFDPAPAGDRMFGVPSPYVAGHLTFHGMALLDYAHNPLVLHSTTGNAALGSIVTNQMFVHLNGSLALWNRLNVNVDVPVALLQTGDSPKAPVVAGQAFTSPGSAQFGDIRLNARVRLVGTYFDLFQLAIAASVWVPSGAKGSYVSDGTVRAMPQLIAGGLRDRFVWAFAAGPDIRPSPFRYANVVQGSMIRWGGGAGVRLGEKRALQLGAEFAAGVTIASPSSVNKRTNNAELLANVRYRVIPDLEIGAAFGPGLSAGIGTPDFRGVLMVAYTPEQKPIPKDRDGDGIPDELDACPDVVGIASEDPKKNGCPPPKDSDGDGIPDSLDACPNDKGVASADPKTNGCPPPKDSDGDGIIDELDACPDKKGVASSDPKKNGCPVEKDSDGDGIPDSLDACPDKKGVKNADATKNGCPGDSDGDGIADDVDACPNEKGPPSAAPDANGCPTSVRVTDAEIVILQQVEFDTGRASIKKASFGLLDEVTEVLKEHPEILKLEIQGHTDSQGNPSQNRALSQDRADAVMKAMVTRGVDPGRVTARGYGQDIPIADNKTETGRTKNRRVQFKIVEKKLVPQP